VHLVDIDPSALSAAADRQRVAAVTRLHPHAPVDLTGIARSVSAWKVGKPTLADVRHAIRDSQTMRLPDLGTHFDVVLSSCLLSQLVGYATDGLGGDEHPGFRDLVCAIRARHLRLMANLLVPGGTGLLVCDLVSSDSRQDLARVPEHDLPGFVHKLSRDGNFFSGLHPEAVQTVLQNEPTLAPFVTEVRPLAPWLWRLGPQRTFLVYAIRFRRTNSRLLLA
jgi:hypothetical protein